MPLRQNYDAAVEVPQTATAQHFAAADGFDAVADSVLGRCSMCHARDPVYDGIRWAPKHIYLETRADIAGCSPADLSAGRGQPCDATGQPDMDGARGTGGNCSLVSWGVQNSAVSLSDALM